MKSELSDSFNTAISASLPPPAVGAWTYGRGWRMITYPLTWKPNWFHRLCMYCCFDIKWIDYPDLPRGSNHDDIYWKIRPSLLQHQ